MTKRIVIGSVLKPLDDVRHFHKLGKTLASLPNVQLFILARKTPYPLTDEDTIFFKPITNSSAFFPNRYFAPLRFLIKLFALHPSLVIVSTHELLRIAVVGKVLLGYKLVYDVQENYRLNIKTNKTYKGLLQKLLTFDVWLSETIAKPFVDQYWLAEACYQGELRLPAERSFVLENKALVPQKVSQVSLKEHNEISMVFSGTIAEENGIWESLELIEKLHALDTRYRLHVVGCCHSLFLLQKLEQKTASKPYITLDVSSLPLPYPVLIKAVQRAHIGLIAYRNQANFVLKMPTKLFEYLVLGKTILLPNLRLWVDYLSPFQCGIVLDFHNIDVKKLHTQLMETIFYPWGNEVPEAMWFSETPKLLSLSAQLLAQ